MSDKNDILNPRDPFKDLFRESAMEKAPESLIPNVLMTLEAEKAGIGTEKPLISIYGWIAIAAVLTGLSLIALMFSDEDTGSGYLSPLARGIENLQLPSADFSSLPETAWLGVLAFGVYGTLQLFWMKRELDRQRLF